MQNQFLPVWLLIQRVVCHKCLSSAILSLIVVSQAYPYRAKTMRFICSLLCLGLHSVRYLTFFNQTPIDSFSKCQNQVEPATYRSELWWQPFVMLHMLHVPIDGPSWHFGDNKSVITSSTIPHSMLNKCWKALSYH